MSDRCRWARETDVLLLDWSRLDSRWTVYSRLNCSPPSSQLRLALFTRSTTTHRLTRPHHSHSSVLNAACGASHHISSFSQLVVSHELPYEAVTSPPLAQPSRWVFKLHRLENISSEEVYSCLGNLCLPIPVTPQVVSFETHARQTPFKKLRT